MGGMLAQRVWKYSIFVILLVVSILLVFAYMAVENGDFTTNLNNWTEVETTNPTLGQTLWDSSGSPNGTGGALRMETTIGRRNEWEGYRYQNITNVLANSTVYLSFDWKGDYRATASQAYFDLYVDILRPGGNITTVWTTGAPVLWGTWYSIIGLDVSSVFNATGNYSLRLRSHLRSGNDGSAQTLSYWDVVNLNVTPPDITPPAVNLSEPGNNAWHTKVNITLYYNVSDDSALKNCSLFVNSTFNQTNRTPILNNAMNNFTLENLTDGDYNWSVLCYDTSIFQNSNRSSTWTFRVDTAPPNASLENPPNNTLNTTHNQIIFYYNVTDVMTDVQVCSLIIDGSIDQSTTASPVQEAQSLNFTTTLSNGDHNWSVNCTDTNGLEGASGIRNISIQISDATVVTNKGSYSLGESVGITGSNWVPGAIITLWVLRSNTSTLYWNTTADGTGQISDTYYINYSHPYGVQNLSAFQYLDPSKNATTTFTVLTPSVSLLPASNESLQGDWMDFTATGFAPASPLTLNMTSLGGEERFNLTTNATGGFFFHYNVSYTAALGAYLARASTDLFPNLNASGTFNVTLRRANLSANESVYGQNDLVNITGFFYTNNGTVSLILKNIDDQQVMATYPKDVYANGTGFITDSWNTGSICAGNFSVEAYDQNHSFLNATAYFNVTRDLLDRSNDSAPDSVVGSDVTAQLSLVNESDNQSQNLGFTDANQERYLEFNWQDSVDPAAQVTHATFYLEHRRDSTKVTSYQVYWLNASSSSYQAISGSGCSGAPPDQEDITTQCDMGGVLFAASDIQDVTIRVNYTRGGSGGAADAYVDYTHLKIDFQEPGPCSVPNNPPMVQAVNIPTPSDLIAGTTALVICNVSVYDGNGANNLTGANATLYYYLNESTDSDDNSTHYTNTSCAVADAGTYVRNYTCSFNVLYYANNGTWTCNATGTDSIAADSGTNTTLIDPLYAMNLTEILDYGNLEPGTTSPDTILNVTNFGNMPLDISLSGFGAEEGDDLALNCTYGNISIDQERYNLSQGTLFADMAPLSALPALLSDFNLGKSIDTNTSFRHVYWKLFIPPPLPMGECNGTITVEAQADG